MKIDLSQLPLLLSITLVLTAWMATNTVNQYATSPTVEYKESYDPQSGEYVLRLRNMSSSIRLNSISIKISALPEESLKYLDTYEAVPPQREINFNESTNNKPDLIFMIDSFQPNATINLGVKCTAEDKPSLHKPSFRYILNDEASGPNPQDDIILFVKASLVTLALGSFASLTLCMIFVSVLILVVDFMRSKYVNTKKKENNCELKSQAFIIPMLFLVLPYCTLYWLSKFPVDL